MLEISKTEIARVAIGSVKSGWPGKEFPAIFRVWTIPIL